MMEIFVSNPSDFAYTLVYRHKNSRIQLDDPLGQFHDNYRIDIYVTMRVGSWYLHQVHSYVGCALIGIGYQGVAYKKIAYALMTS